ncbi:MAG TPA: hypothetical protein P5186_09665 [Candidatus Paceibacterota bacterium]|nr:hypothetical protein [Verrucomicrobiota bacterium]HRY48302.1 hypothetical protein [Candidatus Paceibacterota bacterium]
MHAGFHRVWRRAFGLGQFLVIIGLAAHSVMGSDPVLKVVQQGAGDANLLRNPGFELGTLVQASSWGAAPKGYRAISAEGRSGTRALVCESTHLTEWHGASQSLTLNRTNILPIVVRGWSRAENVSGSADSGYSIYVDIVYRDGTPLWGQTGNFSAGTHDWEERQFVILPDKPVRSISVYCLFRQHSGKVWFDDISLVEIQTPAGAFLFQGTPMSVALSTNPPLGESAFHKTQDHFSIAWTGGRITGLSVDGRELACVAPSGFLARDIAAGSDMFAFENDACPDLNLRLNTTITAKSDHLILEGKVTDTTGADRAIMLVFALPIDAVGWKWNDDLRQQHLIAAPGEYSHTTSVNCGANGRLSLYPLACIYDDRSGLAMALDMAQPAQFRLAYHAGTKQLLIAYDFGLVRETARFPSGAEFRFVLFRFDPYWGYRSAWDKYIALFPSRFAVRSPNQGIWMPFTDVSTVADWQDFGFRYHEGNNNVPFDDRNGILSFRYTEPMTWWMPMAPDLPRSLASALAVRDQYAAGPAGSRQRMAMVSKDAAMEDPRGQPALLFRNEPWANGAVWSLNPNPALPSSPNAATVHWNDALRESLYGAQAKGTLDGEYLDSLEGYVTADLNYRRDHFAHTSVPLTFDTQSKRPALWKALAVFEFTRWISEDLHRFGKLCFANGVPYRFSFLCPWLDIMGTETDWLSNGQYAPSSHAQMLFWRTLSGRKPYLLLMNTDYDRFGSDWVERYFQRCLFYGMFPSMFSHNASENPYWQKPAWYNRDRALFKRYQPLIKQVAEAGWQPITQATSMNTNILVERFGPGPDGVLYFTLFNDSSVIQTTRLSHALDRPGTGVRHLGTELLSGKRLTGPGSDWELQLEPQKAAVIKVERPAQFIDATVLTNGTVRLILDAPLGSQQVLEFSSNLTNWMPLGTNLIAARPFQWPDDLTPAWPHRFYRLRWENVN